MPISLNPTIMSRIFIWFNEGTRPKRIILGAITYFMCLVASFIVLLPFYNNAMISAAIIALCTCLIPCFPITPLTWKKIADFLLIPTTATILITCLI